MAEQNRFDPEYLRSLPDAWDPTRIERTEGNYEGGFTSGYSSSRGPGYFRVNDFMVNPSNKAYAEIKDNPSLIFDEREGWLLPSDTARSIFAKYDDKGGDFIGRIGQAVKPYVPAAIGLLAAGAGTGLLSGAAEAPMFGVVGGSELAGTAALEGTGAIAGGAGMGGGAAGGFGLAQEAAHAGADLIDPWDFMSNVVSGGADVSGYETMPSLPPYTPPQEPGLVDKVLNWADKNSGSLIMNAGGFLRGAMAPSEEEKASALYQAKLEAELEAADAKRRANNLRGINLSRLRPTGVQIRQNPVGLIRGRMQ